MDIENYAGAQCESPYPTEKSCGLGLSNQPSMKDGLLANKKQLELRLQKVNDALAAIEKNPEIATMLETVSKGLRA